MSRGHEGVHRFGEKLLPVTQADVGAAHKHFVRLGKYARQTLWENMKTGNKDLVAWVDEWLGRDHGMDTEERAVIEAALGIAYYLFHRPVETKVMETISLTPDRADYLLPEVSLPVPNIEQTDDYEMLVREMVRFGRLALQSEQDEQLLYRAVWELLPRVLDFDPVKERIADTRENYRSHAKRAVQFIYGCLRRQIEIQQSRGRK